MSESGSVSPIPDSVLPEPVAALTKSGNFNCMIVVGVVIGIIVVYFIWKKYFDKSVKSVSFEASAPNSNKKIDVVTVGSSNCGFSLKQKKAINESGSGLTTYYDMSEIPQGHWCEETAKKLSGVPATLITDGSGNIHVISGFRSMPDLNKEVQEKIAKF